MGWFRRPRLGDAELLPDDTVSRRMEELAEELSEAADELHDLVAEMRLRKEIEAQHAGRDQRGSAIQSRQDDHQAHVEVEREGKLSIDIHTEPSD